MKKKVWFITGASKGLGLSLVKKLLEEGYPVAATSRNAKALEQAVGTASETFLPLGLNLKDEQDVAKGIQAAVDHFGRIDVVVNNAGYGQVGALEELSDPEARENFEVNVFGALNVIRKAMPYLRGQQSGHILNIASIGGFTGGFPGFGIYCATKFALTGLSESLAAEAQPFNVKVTVVSPGYFRTNFLEADSLSVPASPIADYVKVREAQAMHQHDISGNQPGDPDKAAAAMISVVERPDAPLHLLLGQDAYDMAEQKINAMRKDMSAVQELATATGFDN